MKRGFLLLLTFVYALSCAGITLQLHVCKGELVAVSVQQTLGGHRCCNKPDMNKDCCKDITKVVKLEHAGLKHLEIKLATVSPVSVPTILFPLYRIPSGLDKPAVSPDFHPPPLPSSLPRHLALGVILV